MPEFSSALNQLALEDRISRERFREIAARIASDGGLYPDSGRTDRELYDQAVAVEDEIIDYFGVIGCTLVHNRLLRYMRLYPPNASAPAMTAITGGTDDDAALGSSSLRRKVKANVAATALALRLIYSQKLTTGDVIGEGEVETTIQDIGVTLRKQLGRDEGQTQAERRAIIRELEREWHVIRLAAEVDPNDPETRVIIRPMIADLISESLALRVEEDARIAGGTLPDAAEDEDVSQPPNAASERQEGIDE